MKYKKMTKKEIETELQKIAGAMNFIFNKFKEIEAYIYPLGNLLNAYIKFSGDEEKFIKHVKELAKEEKKDEKENIKKHAKLSKKDGDNKKSNK